MKKWLVFIGIALTLSGCVQAQEKTKADDAAQAMAVIDDGTQVESSVETETFAETESAAETETSAETENAIETETSAETENAAETETSAETENAIEMESAVETESAAKTESRKKSTQPSQSPTEEGTAASEEALAAAPTQAEVTEIGRRYVEDCGMDTGYWIIYYSDGHEEYIDG